MVNRRQCEALTSELNLQLGLRAKERALRTRMPVFCCRCLAVAFFPLPLAEGHSAFCTELFGCIADRPAEGQAANKLCNLILAIAH